MTHNTSRGKQTSTWGGDCRERGIKLVVAVVDDAVSALLHKAVHAATTEAWIENRQVHEPGPSGIARVLVTSFYQDLLGFGSDLMIFDPNVADEEAWDVLSDYFTDCGPAGERILLLRPLSLPRGVPEGNVTCTVAPNVLTAEFLRQQVMDAPIRPRPSEDG